MILNQEITNSKAYFVLSKMCEEVVRKQRMDSHNDDVAMQARMEKLWGESDCKMDRKIEVCEQTAQSLLKRVENIETTRTKLKDMEETLNVISRFTKHRDVRVSSIQEDLQEVERALSRTSKPDVSDPILSELGEVREAICEARESSKRIESLDQRMREVHDTLCEVVDSSGDRNVLFQVPTSISKEMDGLQAALVRMSEEAKSVPAELKQMEATMLHINTSIQGRDDQIKSIHKDLEEARQILVETCNLVVQRGEKLETLMAKSSYLERESASFFQKVRLIDWSRTFL